MSNKKIKKAPEKEMSGLKRKVLTGLILGVIALELVLIFYLLLRPKPDAVPQETAQENAQESVEETAGQEAASEPAVVEATVNWHGQEKTIRVKDGQEDYTGAVIDYGEKNWWVEEGFVGQYTMTETTSTLEGTTESFSELTVYENGNVVWVTDGDVYSGELLSSRYYGDAAHGYVTSERDRIPRVFDLEFVKIGNDTVSIFGPEEPLETNFVCIRCKEQTEPDPLDGICVYLERVA